MFATLPKVSLHDHLDGGLRPTSIPELAAMTGHELPAEPNELAQWFCRQADSGDLKTYLTTFDQTVACMQTPTQLRRVAREWVLDAVDDYCVIAEARWAPSQHQRLGMSLSQAVGAVAEGLDDGMRQAAKAGRPIIARQILCVMRQEERSLEIAQLAIDHQNDLVVGLDLAGPERGFPAAQHARAFQLAYDAGLPITIHAGEEDGVSSIRQALESHARRIGHGVRLIDDIANELGSVASDIMERQLALEVCPSSNLQTGAAKSMATHPIARLVSEGFNVTINPDNRLQSATTVTGEYQRVKDAFSFSTTQFEKLTIASAKAAFLPEDVIERVIETQIKPAWQAQI
uniref:adenosine deaminase n=1 Tax=Vaginimicrobium propionicum TaxID=1871034 RepID=UPI0009712B34|nr:adenosine deaminase [Vaginimicrobium propionicum]